MIHYVSMNTSDLIFKLCLRKQQILAYNNMITTIYIFELPEDRQE